MMGAVPYVEREFPVLQPPAPGESAQQRFADVRESAGFFRSTTPNDANPDGYWVFTSYELVREAFQTPTVFSSRMIEVRTPVDARPPHIPIELDPPEHTRYRQMLAPEFTPTRARDAEPFVREICRDVVEGLRHEQRCEFMHDFASVFPTAVFQDVLGIPRENNEQFLVWVGDLLHGGSVEQKVGAIGNIQAYFAEVIRAQLDAPADNLIGFMTQSKIDGRPPTFDELVELCYLLFTAAHDTVPCMLGYLFRHLAENPADRMRILDDESLIPATVEEILRFYTISPTGRVVTQDTDFHGCPLRAGDRVLLATPAADRDTARFPDADTVVIDRSDNPHLGFGGGPHRCLGSHLARLEMRIAVEEWHRAIRDYRVDPDILVTEHAGVLGLNNLPLILGG